MKRKNRAAEAESTVVVTGPGVEGRSVPNVGCGVGFAQFAAAQHGSTEGGETWYVRDGDMVVARVEYVDDVIVTVAA